MYEKVRLNTKTVSRRHLSPGPETGWHHQSKEEYGIVFAMLSPGFPPFFLNEYSRGMRIHELSTL
jgi:hypothetical protein